MTLSGSGSLLVMEMSFKRGQTCHDKESSEIAKERYLAPGQNRIDTHPASPEVSQIHEAVDFFAISLLIRGRSFWTSSPEIGLRSQRRKNALARIIGETLTTSFQHLHLATANHRWPSDICPVPLLVNDLPCERLLPSNMSSCPQSLPQHTH